VNMTLLKTTMIAAIASLGISNQSWAHHPSEDMNPNYDVVDEQVSDMHNEAIDSMLEDDDLMSSTARGMDATSMGSGDSLDASTATTSGAAQTVTASGPGTASTARGSGGPR